MTLTGDVYQESDAVEVCSGCWNGHLTRKIPKTAAVSLAPYRKVKGGCGSHQIRNIVLEQLLLTDIQCITTDAKDHEENFLKLVTGLSEKELNKTYKDNRKELDKTNQQIVKLDIIIQKLYEDNVKGKISNERIV